MECLCQLKSLSQGKDYWVLPKLNLPYESFPSPGDRWQIPFLHISVLPSGTWTRLCLQSVIDVVVQGFLCLYLKRSWNPNRISMRWCTFFARNFFQICDELMANEALHLFCHVIIRSQIFPWSVRKKKTCEEALQHWKMMLWKVMIII